MNKMGNKDIRIFINKVMLSKQEFFIKIENENGSEVGRLRPIIQEDLNNDSLLEKLTRWRNDNMGMFLTSFAATTDRTRVYLKGITSENSSQTLFIVEEDGKIVGQVGWKDLNENDAIMDNGMKGERTNNPKLLIYAHRSLAKWLFANTSIKSMLGWLVTDNIPGIMMNKQIGWSKWLRHPLVKRKQGEEWAWEIGAEGDNSPDNKYCFKLIMEEADVTTIK